MVTCLPQHVSGSCLELPCILRIRSGFVGLHQVRRDDLDDLVFLVSRARLEVGGHREVLRLALLFREGLVCHTFHQVLEESVLPPLR